MYSRLGIHTTVYPAQCSGTTLDGRDSELISVEFD